MNELISLIQKHQSANDCMLKEKLEKKHQKNQSCYSVLYGK